ncbi:hypothetical protein TELCIR_00082 [Teladorsagia circumcincta]|uniref:Uncharacterized protein n=1 Tax=Teladorsagia circumcincta TaxID=45464 RepID=A0A2G9V7T2_TELCI|nr:hypothetical protein TELCIR_00082 [Teladorsagia circumcincta]
MDIFEYLREKEGNPGRKPVGGNNSPMDSSNQLASAAVYFAICRHHTLGTRQPPPPIVAPQVLLPNPMPGPFPLPRHVTPSPPPGPVSPVPAPQPPVQETAPLPQGIRPLPPIPNPILGRPVAGTPKSGSDRSPPKPPPALLPVPQPVPVPPPKPSSPKMLAPPPLVPVPRQVVPSPGPGTPQNIASPVPQIGTPVGALARSAQNTPLGGTPAVSKRSAVQHVEFIEINQLQQQFQCCGMKGSIQQNNSEIPHMKGDHPWKIWFESYSLDETYPNVIRELYSLPWSCCNITFGVKCEHIGISRYQRNFDNPTDFNDVEAALHVPELNWNPTSYEHYLDRNALAIGTLYSRDCAEAFLSGIEENSESIEGLLFKAGVTPSAGSK